MSIIKTKLGVVETSTKIISTTYLNTFKVIGEATILDWYSNKGKVHMIDIFISLENSEKLSTELIFSKLNDGGFGAQKILSAKCFIFQRTETLEIDQEMTEEIYVDWFQLHDKPKIIKEKNK